jgi:hypothetical protein
MKKNTRHFSVDAFSRECRTLLLGNKVSFRPSPSSWRRLPSLRTYTWSHCVYECTRYMYCRRLFFRPSAYYYCVRTYTSRPDSAGFRPHVPFQAPLLFSIDAPRLETEVARSFTSRLLTTLRSFGAMAPLPSVVATLGRTIFKGIKMCAREK